MKSRGLKIFFFLVSVIWVVSTYAQGETEPIGIVTTVKGQVTVVSVAGGNEVVEQGARVFLGDKFETGEDSGAKILFNDDTLISLGSDTAFEVTEFVYTPTERKSFSNIVKGQLKATIQKFDGGQSSVEFATPNSIAGIKGTILFIDADREIISFLEGEGFVRGIIPGAIEIRVGPGEFSRIINGNPSSPVPTPDELKNELKEGAEVQEEAPSRDALNKEEYLGKKTPHVGVLPSAETTVPLEQPINQLPGVNARNEAPVIIDPIPESP